MYRILLSLLALINGGFMLADGIHVLLKGKYIGPEKPGPWSGLFREAGIDVFNLGPLFVLFGILWLILLYGIIRRAKWIYSYGIIISVATLWYLPFGTLIALITGIMLLAKKKSFNNSRIKG